LGLWTGAAGAEQTVLYRVDLSSIPSNAPVTAAMLYLYGPFSYGGNAVVDVSVYKVNELNNIAEASWTNRFGTTPWTTSGGGLAAIGSAESTTEVSTALQWWGWDIATMVQGWITTPSTNYGLLLVADQEVTSGTNRYFRSSDYSDTAMRPFEVVSYTTPTIFTATGSTLGIAGGGGGLE
jgi:hypothetical protein